MIEPHIFVRDASSSADDPFCNRCGHGPEHELHIKRYQPQEERCFVDADVRIGDFVLHQSPEGKLFLWRDGEGMEVESKSLETALKAYWDESF